MIGGQNYTLRGMIQHDGGTEGGHYTYLYHDPTPKTTRQQKGPWIVFNDKSVTSLSLRPDEMINTGYIYLFQKEGSFGRLYKGMQNHGNSCWMNAALQMFYHIPEYREYIEGFKAIPPPNHSNVIPLNDINAITLALQAIFLKYSGGEYSALECSIEYQTLFKATFPDKTIGSQQDAMEFIDKVLLDIIEKVPAVRSLFEIQYESTISCKNPPMDPSVNTMHLTALRLPIPSTPSTLDQLLEDYSKPHPIDYKVGTTPCPTATQTATIQTTTAKYVILQLNRFENALSL
jgi:uncharacterized UBP type Zn finger protein